MMAGSSGASISVFTLKKIAEELENGKGKWDMKPALLNGPKAKMGKKGKYNIIPFRHGTSNEHAPNNNFKTMPQEIYRQARQLKASVRSGSGMAWGGRLPATSAAASNPTTGYQHKSDVHKGMVRIEKKYKSATQNKYMTFRVVSSNSDPASWWHPGYEAHHIARGVGEYCKPAVEQMLHAAAQQDLVDAIVNIGYR
jgi:hypothetical protein